MIDHIIHVHSWRLGTSKQYKWQEEHYYKDKTTIFGNYKTEYISLICARIDEFYCVDCLEIKYKKRQSIDEGTPIWWLDNLGPDIYGWSGPPDIYEDTI